mmetsp:Transcript_24805/g.35734  ORF Transcript_24805/g.35734 Transcript_24805/m.35734 type:complete len:118 (+) Transcript_24805:985-1338(+)
MLAFSLRILVRRMLLPSWRSIGIGTSVSTTTFRARDALVSSDHFPKETRGSKNRMHGTWKENHFFPLDKCVDELHFSTKSKLNLRDNQTRGYGSEAQGRHQVREERAQEDLSHKLIP